MDKLWCQSEHILLVPWYNPGDHRGQEKKPGKLMLVAKTQCSVSLLQMHIHVVYFTDCTLAPDKESTYVHVMLLLL